MDSFATIFFSKVDDAVAQPPTNEENSGGSGNGYCVISREVINQTPVNEENSGGSGNGYCVIA